jgi:hypothetical protein
MNVYGAEIYSVGFPAPRSDLEGPSLPRGAVGLSERSKKFLNAAAINNAFSGVMHIETGEIHLYPLSDEPAEAIKIYLGMGTDGYSTSKFPGASDAVNADILADPSRPLSLGDVKRTRRMSEPTLPGKVTPINHNDPLWSDWVSHEQIARRYGGGVMNEEQQDLVGDPISLFIGFTVKVTLPRLTLICTSRGLNTSKFPDGGGKVNTEWALKIKNAFERISLNVRAQDDGGLQVRPLTKDDIEFDEPKFWLKAMKAHMRR